MFPTSLKALACGGLLAVAAAAIPAAAADWKPASPVTIIVPYAPGGGTDAQARSIAKELARIWAQPVIVENRPGADSVIGTRFVMDAKPNGLTLLVNLPAIALIKHTPTYKGIDPVAKLTAVTAFSSLPGILVENAAVPAKSMGELVRYCKTAPQPCSLGTTENMARLYARMVEEKLIPKLIVANYKGGGQLIADLVANNVNTAIMGISAVLPHHKSGTVRVVMTMGDKRSAVLPDVQTAAEAGFPELTVPTWYGLFAPQGTPPDITQGIASAVREALKAEGPKQMFANVGAEPLGNSPAEFAAMLKTQADKVAELTRRFPLE